MTEKQKHQKLILLYYIYYLTVKVYNLLITCRVFFYVPAEPRCRSAPWIQGGWFWGVFVGVGLGWRGVCPTRSDRRLEGSFTTGQPHRTVLLLATSAHRPSDPQPGDPSRPGPYHLARSPRSSGAALVADHRRVEQRGVAVARGGDRCGPCRSRWTMCNWHA